MAVPEQGRPDRPGPPGPLPAHLWGTRERKGRPGREEPDRSAAVTHGAGVEVTVLAVARGGTVSSPQEEDSEKVRVQIKVFSQSSAFGPAGQRVRAHVPSASLAEGLAGRHSVPRPEPLLKIPFFSLSTHTL